VDELNAYACDASVKNSQVRRAKQTRYKPKQYQKRAQRVGRKINDDMSKMNNKSGRNRLNKGKKDKSVINHIPTFFDHSSDEQKDEQQSHNNKIESAYTQMSKALLTKTLNGGKVTEKDIYMNMTNDSKLRSILAKKHVVKKQQDRSNKRLHTQS